MCELPSEFILWSLDDDESVSLFVDNALFVLSEIERLVDDDNAIDPEDWRVDLPNAFQLEVAALCFIIIWEVTGVTAAESLDVPPVQAVIDDLRYRIMSDTESFFDDEYLPELFTRVQRLTGGLVSSAEFDSEFVVLNVTADLLVESVAQLIWAVRRRLPAQSSQVADKGKRQ